MSSPNRGQPCRTQGPPPTFGNLITSRNPDDLPAFTSALLETVAHGSASQDA